MVNEFITEKKWINLADSFYSLQAVYWVYISTGAAYPLRADDAFYLWKREIVLFYNSHTVTIEHAQT